MKVFIIGIAGGVGRFVAEKLVALNHDVDGLVRQPARGEALGRSGIATTPGNLVTMSIAELATALSGTDAVVFTAGAGGKDGPDATRQVDGDGPAKVAAAAKVAGVRRFVLVSVFPEAWRERRMPQEFETYMIEKKRAETELVLTDLDWVVIRPSALTDGAGVGTIDLGVAKIHAENAREDVAAVIVEVLEEPKVNRVILELTAGATRIREAVKALTR